jgi:hypothetical protein
VNPVLRVPALVPFLRCPDLRCKQAFIHVESEERFRGLVKCMRKTCQQRWFAEPLERGNVRYQLEETYGDPNIVNDLMIRLNLPDDITEPMFLQIPLSAELWSGYMNDRDRRPRSRTRRLVRLVLDALPLMSNVARS